MVTFAIQTGAASPLQIPGTAHRVVRIAARSGDVAAVALPWSGSLGTACPVVGAMCRQEKTYHRSSKAVNRIVNHSAQNTTIPNTP